MLFASYSFPNRRATNLDLSCLEVKKKGNMTKYIIFNVKRGKKKKNAPVL